MYTCTHKQSHPHTQTCTHIYNDTHAHATHMLVLTHTCTRTHACTYIYKQQQHHIFCTHKHIYICIHTHSQISTQHMRTHTRTHIHTYKTTPSHSCMRVLIQQLPTKSNLSCVWMYIYRDRGRERTQIFLSCIFTHTYLYADICLYIYMCVYLYIYTHIRTEQMQAYEPHNRNGGFRRYYIYVYEWDRLRS